MPIRTIIAIIMIVALSPAGVAADKVGVYRYPFSRIKIPDTPEITSGRGGWHMPSSPHHSGQAIDLSVENLTRTQCLDMARALREQLGSDYDVICDYRGTPGDHIHLEYDPDEYDKATPDYRGFENVPAEWLATTGDFNGDGEVDYAWLEVDGEENLLLMAEVAERQYAYKKGSAKGLLNLYVDTVKPGVYATMCAKGYGPACRPDQLRSVTLAHNGLLFGTYESAAQLWYWTGAGFSEVWVSD